MRNRHYLYAYVKKRGGADNSGWYCKLRVFYYTVLKMDWVLTLIEIKLPLKSFVRNPLRLFFLKGEKWETLLAEVGFGFEGVNKQLEMAAEM